MPKPNTPHMPPFDIPAFLQRVTDFVSRESLFVPGQPLLVAVSGGVDSVVLCDIIHQLQYPFAIAHVNYQLRGEDSQRDEQFVRQLGHRYGVQVYVHLADTQAFALASKQSIQEAARTIRYHWFSQLLLQPFPWPDAMGKPGSPRRKGQLQTRLLTAHHQDDTIETAILNFFRGGGLSGLRGMLPATPLVARPLLFATREEIAQYAAASNLSWTEDASNAELKYTRNRIRHILLPELEEMFPGFKQHMMAQMERFRDTESYLHHSLAQKLRRWVVQKDAEYWLPVNRLKQEPGAGTILFFFLKGFGFHAAQSAEALRLLDAHSGKQVLTEDYRIYRHRAWLVLAPRVTEDPGAVYIAELPADCLTPLGRLTLQSLSGKPEPRLIQDRPDIQYLDAADIRFPLLLRPWKPGDYFYPLGMPKKKKLARFFIDQKMPATEKERQWVLQMADGPILAIIGNRIDHRFRIRESTASVLALQLLHP